MGDLRAGPGTGHLARGRGLVPNLFPGLLRDPPARSAGRSGPVCRAAGALLLAGRAAAVFVNVSVCGGGWARSVTADAIAPMAVGGVVDRVVAVDRRPALAAREASAWGAVGRTPGATARIAGLV